MAVEFRIRDFFYPAAICRLRRLLEAAQWLPADELAVYQERQLSAILQQACRYVPYYRHLFSQLKMDASDIRCADDLARLPLLSRDTVQNAGQQLVAENARRFRPRMYRTSGTMGSPMSICLDRHANVLEFVYYWRHWSWAGYNLGDCFAQLDSLYFLRRPGLAKVIWRWQPHLRRLLINSIQTGPAQAAEVAAAIRRYRPRFLNGVASSLYFLAVCLRDAGIDDLSFQAVFSKGEVMGPQYRTLVESVFHCPVLDSYGHMERTVAISQCLHGGYHVNSDYGLLQFENVKPVGNGPTSIGRAVGTSLYNLAMPLIRYDVEDDIELFNEPVQCPCGRTLPLVKGIHGRSEDTITTPDGRFITSMFVLPELVTGAKLIQFIQKSPTQLQINVVPGNGWSDRQAALLVEYAQRLTGHDMAVRIDPVGWEEIVRDKSGKIRTVISLTKEHQMP